MGKNEWLEAARAAILVNQGLAGEPARDIREVAKACRCPQCDGTHGTEKRKNYVIQASRAGGGYALVCDRCASMVGLARESQELLDGSMARVYRVKVNEKFTYRVGAGVGTETEE